jgi:hypothetical protein
MDDSDWVTLFHAQACKTTDKFFSLQKVELEFQL